MESEQKRNITLSRLLLRKPRGETARELYEKKHQTKVYDYKYLVNRKSRSSYEKERNKNIFKKISMKKSKETDLSSSIEVQKRTAEFEAEFSLDKARWCRLMKKPESCKIFTCAKGFPQIAESLTKRGWIENPNPKSDIFDFLFTMRVKNIRKNLKEGQIINRFVKTSALCSKLGLLQSMRNLKWFANIDEDSCVPRAYNLTRIVGKDKAEEEYAFAYDFQVTALENYFGKVLHLHNNRNLTISSNLNAEKAILEDCLRHLEKYYLSRNSFFQKRRNKSSFLSIELWSAFKKIEEQSEVPEISFELLEKILKLNPEKDTLQNKINGKLGKNIWIVKPAGKSRGRGIRCFRELKDILEYTREPVSSQWIVQKYIENPLIIFGRKFDIRQWVLVSCWNPLTVWFSTDCYLRFCASDYSVETKDLSDCFVHLANNAISKHSKEVDSRFPGNMWSKSTFESYLREKFPQKDVWSAIQRKMKELVKHSISCVQNMIETRKDSFEIYGYDFMISEDFDTLLIEVNSSPAMDYSTSVTETIVKQSLQDLLKVILDVKHDKKLKRKSSLDKTIDTGLWEILLQQKEISVKPESLVYLKTLQISGKELKSRKKIKKKPKKTVNIKFHDTE
eukprot:maker-scaffold_43-snap-gene-1.29-mRNA-1 protein AED:0.14 eAED:0.14 QI:0/0/0/1/1/1/3/0/620